MRYAIDRQDKVDSDNVLLCCDVLVCGGGPAGIAAACTAARAGKYTVLAESGGYLGGASVAGLSGTICGLYLAGEESQRPQPLVTGFADEFVRALESAGE